MSLQRKKKSFGSNVPAEIAGLEVEFCGKSFKVRPRMSGLSLLRVIAAMEGEDEGAAANAMTYFLELAFLTEDREEAMETLANGEPPLELDQLSDLIQWLIGEYTGNSTDPSQSSTSGQDSDGSTTTVVLSETVSTSEPSPATESSSLPS